jgi:hypothetical protein
MSDDEVTAALGAPDAARRALRGWQQRIQAVLEIARDDDDLAARLPVLDQLAAELVAALGVARAGLEAAAGHLPAEADVLRHAVRDAHELLHGIELWHRPPSVAALRKARDRFRVAADRLDA